MEKPSGGEAQATGQPDVKAEARGKKEEVKETARETKEELKSAARETKEELKSAAEDKVQEQTRTLSRKARAVARALHEAGTALEGEGEGRMGRYGHEAGDQVERAAGYLERNDLQGLVRDLEDTARSNTGAFVGGTFALGLVLGRFLRSGSPEPADGGERDPATTPRSAPAAMSPPSMGTSTRRTAAARGSGPTQGESQMRSDSAARAGRAAGGDSGTRAEPGRTSDE